MLHNLNKHIYTGSNTLMGTCVTLTDLAGWNISVKTAKFWSRGQMKSSSSNIYQNLVLYSDLPFIKAFFWNRTLRTSIVSCAILSDLVRWSFKKNSVSQSVGHFQNFYFVKFFTGYAYTGWPKSNYPHATLQ